MMVQFLNNFLLQCDVVTATGMYSCLSVDMQFKRQMSYYVVTIYVPTFMIVCVSWMSFWLDHKSAPARVSLTITTLLAMATTTSSINNSMPPVSYIKVKIKDFWEGKSFDKTWRGPKNLQFLALQKNFVSLIQCYFLPQGVTWLPLAPSFDPLFCITLPYPLKHKQLLHRKINIFGKQ